MDKINAYKMQVLEFGYNEWAKLDFWDFAEQSFVAFWGGSGGEGEFHRPVANIHKAEKLALTAFCKSWKSKQCSLDSFRVLIQNLDHKSQIIGGNPFSWFPAFCM